MTDFVDDIMAQIEARKKNTSPLYQKILAGRGGPTLMQNFILHRLPIKNVWTRNIMGIASQIEEPGLRAGLVENIFEEETGQLTKSKRHVESFMDVGAAFGLDRAAMLNPPVEPETAAVRDHNIETCNGGTHFTAGVASVLLLMEGQPPIIDDTSGTSMLSVMRDVYGLPDWGYDYFIHHANADEDDDAVSELEDEHAEIAKDILRTYCTTRELQDQAVFYLKRALDRRHAHFDMILNRFDATGEAPFRYDPAQERAAS
jgi:pyrroloquinoline-quinone synthase